MYSQNLILTLESKKFIIKELDMPVGKDCMMVMIRDKISLKFVTKMRVSKIIREEVS